MASTVVGKDQMDEDGEDQLFMHQQVPEDNLKTWL